MSNRKRRKGEYLPNPHRHEPRGAADKDVEELGEPDGYIIVENHPTAYWLPKTRTQ